MILKVEVDIDILQAERPLFDTLRHVMERVGMAAAEPGAVEGVIEHAWPNVRPGPEAGRWWLE